MKRRLILALAIPAMLATPSVAGEPKGVTYFQAKEVSAAFAKGSALVEEANYKVHASHREGPGQAEVHTADTDVIYVIEGGATFVTGGTVEDGRTIAPEEIRGSGIRGGDTRRLVRGDVIIVPNGTPHWFKSLDGPFTYYVVKVRQEEGR